MTTIHVQAVLFDMDGTLVDSTALVEQMWTEFAHAHGLVAREVIDFAHGRPSTATITRYLSDPSDIAHWTEEIHAREASGFDAVIEVPGSVAVTTAIPRERWAVVTSALAAPARARLEAVGIVPPDVLVGADDVRSGKPHPEGYLAAAVALGVDPRACVVCEDTPAGIEAGLAAGAQAVVVGDAQAPVMEGVPRVPDMRAVTIEVTDGGLTVTLAD